MMSGLNGATRHAANGLSILGGVALVAMLVHINLDVIGRFVFDRPIPMTTEIVSYYYMVAVVFLPLAAVECHDKHIVVELLSQNLSVKGAMITVGFGSLVAAAYFAALTWRTGQEALAKFQIGEYALGAATLVTWPTRFLVPIGCFVLVLALILSTCRVARGTR